jgi:hypothetical protein
LSLCGTGHRTLRDCPISPGLNPFSVMVIAFG